MQIFDVSGKKIRACFVFEYKGYEVSATTILKPKEVCVFQTRMDHKPLFTGYTVPSAMEWIDKQAQQQRTRQ